MYELTEFYPKNEHLRIVQRYITVQTRTAMHHFSPFLLTLAIIIAPTSKVSWAQTPSSNNSTHMDSLSYQIGVIIGQNIRENGFDSLDYESFLRGVTDYLEGKTSGADLERAQLYVHQYLQERQQKQFRDKIERAEAFFQQNAQRPEVHVLPSGVQYEILRQGDGPKPQLTDKVRVHYRGTLLDGTVFDSSYDRGQPIEFALNQVIKGWQDALQHMPVGSKWKIYIPYQLGYGERGAGNVIGPYEPLIFEVELLDIVK